MLSIIDELYDIGAFRFGEFTLQGGMTTPIYVDLRLSMSFPELLIKISDALFEKSENIPCDLLCGVPYSAHSMTTAISIRHNIPMIMKRKEPKGYGTNRLIEGVFQVGQQCVIIEDIIVSGRSALDTAHALEEVGLKATDLIVILDREQGGINNLAKHGIKTHPLFKLTEAMDHLASQGKIEEEMKRRIFEFIKNHQTTLS